MKKRRAKLSTPRPSKKFVTARDQLAKEGEELLAGPYTELESTVVQLCCANNESVAGVVSIYNLVTDICSSDKCSDVVRQKSLASLQRKKTSLLGKWRGYLQTNI